MAESLRSDLQEALFLDEESAKQIVSNVEALPDTEVGPFLSDLLGADSPAIPIYLCSRSKGKSKSKSKSREPSRSASPAPLHNEEPVRGPQGLDKPLMNFVSKGVWEAPSVQKKKKKKKSDSQRSSKTVNEIKVGNLNDIESAIREIELGNRNTKDRKPCNCRATRHPLLEVAPNCLNCGKIICIKEGLGPCTLCGEPLIDNEQLTNINTILQLEKEEITSSMGRKARQKANVDLGTTVSTLNAKNFGSKSAVNEAEERLNKLLEFQDTSAQRTKIIDQVSDFETPGYGVNQWASPLEQAQQLKRQQHMLRKAEQQKAARSGRGKRIISIDLKGNKVYAEEREAEVESSEEDDEDRALEEGIAKEATKKSAKAAATWDPKSYGKKFIKPTYIEPKGRGKQKAAAGPRLVAEAASRTAEERIVQADEDETRILEL
ncbi:RQC trigger complex subunit Rqt4p [Trichomonascus vanleenenianus]|uniref:Rqt4p n=1 Tax=Trichomonascus vanleenenianus TaxID=2268995 RepID=UPI003ECB2ADC